MRSLIHFIIKFYFTIFTAIAAIILSSIAYADDSTDLSTMLNAIHTLRANFAQTVYDNRNKAIQSSYGRIAWQRPGKFRWEVTKPIPQIIIANSTRLWIYDPDLAQVTIRALQGAAGETPALLLSHDNTSLDKKFLIRALPKKSSQVWFSLKPKKPDNSFSLIEMSFENKQIREMRLKDNLGHHTVIRFKNIESNISLPLSLFVFKPSAKIDVIDETRKKKK